MLLCKVKVTEYWYMFYIHFLLFCVRAYACDHKHLKLVHTCMVGPSYTYSVHVTVLCVLVIGFIVVAQGTVQAASCVQGRPDEYKGQRHVMVT